MEQPRGRYETSLLPVLHGRLVGGWCSLILLLLFFVGVVWVFCLFVFIYLFVVGGFLGGWGVVLFLYCFCVGFFVVFVFFFGGGGTGLSILGCVCRVCVLVLLGKKCLIFVFFVVFVFLLLLLKGDKCLIFVHANCFVLFVCFWVVLGGFLEGSCVGYFFFGMFFDGGGEGGLESGCVFLRGRVLPFALMFVCCWVFCFVCLFVFVVCCFCC